jgi:Methylpurine-DNA glycosylase (MPG)
LPIQRKRVAAHPSHAIASAPVGHLRRLRRSELPEDTIELARFLIGKVLVRDHRGDRTSGRIVETEAYPVGDAAGHAFIGMTAANYPKFGSWLVWVWRASVHDQPHGARFFAFRHSPCG